MLTDQFVNLDILLELELYFACDLLARAQQGE